LGDTYKDNRKFSDQFLPEIQQILVPYLMGPADIQYDTKEATDLMMIDAKDKRIACRVRRDDAMKWRHQFTIRYRSQVQTYSELHKIAWGFGDWLFYGIANKEETALQRWCIVCLRAFRYHRQMSTDQISSGVIQNTGDPTQFMWFDLRTFPERPPILIGCSHPHDYA